MSYLIPEKPNLPQSDVSGFVKAIERLKRQHEIESISCPVCGYYCLGNGGNGCIDKPAMLVAARSK